MSTISAIIGGVYRHYKGHIYTVTAIARHTETMEDMVIYKDAENTWARPARMWDERVTVNGETRPRFELISKEDADA